MQRFTLLADGVHGSDGFALVCCQAPSEDAAEIGLFNQGSV